MFDSFRGDATDFRPFSTEGFFSAGLVMRVEAQQHAVASALRDTMTQKHVETDMQARERHTQRARGSFPE